MLKNRKGPCLVGQSGQLTAEYKHREQAIYRSPDTVYKGGNVKFGDGITIQKSLFAGSIFQLSFTPREATCP